MGRKLMTVWLGLCYVLFVIIPILDFSRNIFEEPRDTAFRRMLIKDLEDETCSEYVKRPLTELVPLKPDESCATLYMARLEFVSAPSKARAPFALHSFDGVKAWQAIDAHFRLWTWYYLVPVAGVLFSSFALGAAVHYVLERRRQRRHAEQAETRGTQHLGS